MNDKPLKLEFAPGCFDNFDGSQQELDSLIAEINALVESGELFEHAISVDLDEFEEMASDEYELTMNVTVDNIGKRTVH
jgi:hypothetical protein